jgi:hypothetical protein
MSGIICSNSDRSNRREIAAKIDNEMSRLSGQVATAELRVTMSELRRHWEGLIGLLDLGPPPELRECPVCGRFGMREATLCGYCWTKLVPPDSRKPATAA